MGVLRITATTFVHLQWTTFPDYPSSALRKVDAMVAFTSFSEHLCDFMTAAEKKNKLLSKSFFTAVDLHVILRSLNYMT